ncbi:MAG: heme o synthase [bacterium]|nr:heme o synthase [bacterium]
MSAVASVEQSRERARIADFAVLLRPRISVMVLFVVFVSAFVSSWGQPNPWTLSLGMLGVLLVAASASVFNQVIERNSDRLMERTESRPLATRRISPTQASWFGAILLAAGLAVLLVGVSWLSFFLSVATWASYVFAYTPLKRKTWLNTAVGAVPGAMPVLLGWSAAGVDAGGLWQNHRAWGLFLLLLLWQFPHFMAIAWLYRKDYARGGMKMLTVVEPTGKAAGVQAVAIALALLPVSFIPLLQAPGASVYMAIALALGVFQLACAWRFLICRDDVSARRLLRASLIYLPAILLVYLAAPWI